MYISYSNREYVGIDSLLGKVIKDIHNEDDVIKFTTTDNEEFYMFHEQDCCESVYIEDINGDLTDLIGSPILLAEEVTELGDDYYGTFTWTFYKIATIDGSVTIRWYGSSNGYYSESVSIIKSKGKE